MSVTEARLLELKRILSHYVKNHKREALNAARDLLDELEGAKAITAMGCREECAPCAWGRPGAAAWQNPCRLWSLRESLSDLDPRAPAGPAVRRQAAELLEALEKSLLPT